MLIFSGDIITFEFIGGKIITCKVHLENEKRRLVTDRIYGSSHGEIYKQLGIGLDHRTKAAIASGGFAGLAGSVSPQFYNSSYLIRFLQYIQSDYKHMLFGIKIGISKIPLPLISVEDHKNISIKLAEISFPMKQKTDTEEKYTAVEPKKYINLLNRMDIITIDLGGSPIPYTVQRDHLAEENSRNDIWFQKIGINKDIAAENMYGYIRNYGVWPTYNWDDYAAATRLVNYLIDETIKQYPKCIITYRKRSGDDTYNSVKYLHGEPSSPKEEFNQTRQAERKEDTTATQSEEIAQQEEGKDESIVLSPDLCSIQPIVVEAPDIHLL